MQRVRIGIIGLAAVFLLVILAAALYALFGNGPHGAVPGEPGLASVDANGSGGPREPLAELGVTPGNAPPESNRIVPPASASGVPAGRATPAAGPPIPIPAN